MAYTTIDDPTLFFEAVTYTGNTSSGTTINDLSFRPDFVWFKSRTQTENHQIYDSVRGATKRLVVNGTQSEATASTGLTSFDSDGFTTGGENETDSGNIVAWNWKAGTSFTNDASATGVGSHDSSGSINTTAGFSIIKYNLSSIGNPSTVAHGLNAVPKLIIMKNKDANDHWYVYSSAIGNNRYVKLDDTSAQSSTSTGFMNNTDPTSSVFTQTSTWWGTNNQDVIAYCFADIKGYSKFGKYTGNDNADGTFVYTGFAPAWVMIKRTNSVNDWIMLDRKRNPINPSDERILANSSNAASTANTMVDFLSNGFKPRSTYGGINGASDNFIYLALAESPFVNSNGVPNNAR